MASEKNIEKKKEDILKEINAMYGVAPEEEETPAEGNPEEGSLAEELTFNEQPVSETKTEKAENAPSDKKSEKTEDAEKKDAEAGTDSEDASESEVDDLSEDEFEDMEIHEVKASIPLPKYGEGGKFIPITIITTIVAVFAGHLPYIRYGIPNPAGVRYFYIFVGVVFIFFGLKMIADARVECAIYENIMLGKLVKSGIYSKTRNPIYGGIIFICTGVLFISGNAFMYILPIVYWAFLSILMRRTEEVLLKSRFGEEYIDYRNHVNCFIPRKQEPEKDIIKFIFDKKK